MLVEIIKGDGGTVVSGEVIARLDTWPRRPEVVTAAWRRKAAEASGSTTAPAGTAAMAMPSAAS